MPVHTTSPCANLTSEMLLCACAGSLAQARALLSAPAAPGTAYSTLERLVSLSIKLYDATPSQLPLQLREDLLAVVAGGLLPESFLRPGCLQLTLDVYQAVTAAAAPAPGGPVVSLRAMDVAKQLIGDGATFWSSQSRLQVQLGSTTATARHGQVSQAAGSCSTASPYIESVNPLCITTADDTGSQWIRLDCCSMSDGPLHLTVRGQGQYYEVGMLLENTDACICTCMLHCEFW